jgi:serine phosphatase RsbU (regulator of sigma subunit)/PAS domain-containing protein
MDGLLTEAGRLLASSLDLDDTLRNIARLAVPELADWAAVDVLQADGSLRQLSSGHPDPAADALLLELRERHRRHGAAPGVRHVIVQRRPEVFAPAPAKSLPFASTAEARLWEQLGPVSFLVVPMEAGGHALGALTLLSTSEERVYSEADFPVALELADRCAQALRNAQAYAAAESSRALLDVLIDTAPVGMAFVDTDLRYVLINRQLAALNRKPVAEHLGRTMDDVLGAEGDERVRLARRALRTGVAVRDREILGDDGRAFLASYAPVAGERGTLGVVFAIVETTERHRAAAAIARSEARFRALAESGVIGVVHGRGEAVVDANEAFLRMLGATHDDVLAGRFTLPEVTPDRPTIAPFETEYRRRDGTAVPVLIGATLLPDAADEWICFVVDLTERHAADRERERLLERTARLQEVTERLAAALTKDEVAEVIVKAGMAATGASCGVLGLRTEERVLRIEHRFGMAEGAPSELPLDLAAPMPTAARTAAPVLIESRADWLWRFPDFPPRGDFEAFAAVPLLLEGGVPGCMGLGFPERGRFDTADVDLLVAIARQGAQAIERARLYEERAYVARTLQAGLLPRALPDIPGIEVAVRYRPVGDGSEVGGDFYDLFETEAGTWMLAIGDVCGKGTEAAVLTGVVRSTIRALALTAREAGAVEVLSGVNAALLREAAPNSLATAACGVLRREGDGCAVTLSTAGHPPPLVLRAAGEVEVVDAPGRMLGVAPAPDLASTTVRLAPGDLLLLYTDGVLDARTRRDTFGEERLRATLARCAGEPPASVVRDIDAAVRAFAPGRARDDKALMALRVPPV